MFVVRYLVVAVTLATVTVGWGLAQGWGGWRVAGLTLLVLLILQVATVGLVAVLAFRSAGGRGPSARRSKPAAANLPNHLVILPR